MSKRAQSLNFRLQILFFSGQLTESQMFLSGRTDTRSTQNYNSEPHKNKRKRQFILNLRQKTKKNLTLIFTSFCRSKRADSKYIYIYIYIL